MTFYRLFMIVIFPLTVLAACSSKPEQKPPPPPMNVGVLSVDRGVIEHTLDMSGTLTFIANTTVSSEVSAQVKSLEVTDGQPLKEGQLLLVFDDTKIRETANQAQANLQKDEATLTFNKTEWEKNLGLLKTGSVSQTQFDQKLSSYQNVVAQVEADKAVSGKGQRGSEENESIIPHHRPAFESIHREGRLGVGRRKAVSGQ